MLGRQGEAENPQVSRLVSSKVEGQSQDSTCLNKIFTNTSPQYNVGITDTKRTTQIGDTGLGHSPDNGNHPCNSRTDTTESESELERRKKRDRSGTFKESTEELTTEKQLLPQIKRPRNGSDSASSCSSHEQRLSSSLDEALFSALQGRPSFTSNLSQQQRVVTAASGPPNTTQHCQSSGSASVSTGEKRCSACSCSVSVYSTSVSSIYRLACSHLLCHACLRRQSHPVTAVTPNHILCPACQSPTPRSDIMRVHH